MKKLKMFFVALMTLVAATAFAQTQTVKGVVTDSSTGEGVPFASVIEKGTMNGVSTNAEGEYTIKVSKNGTLSFTSIGYKAQEVAVSGRDEIKVVLDPDARMLDETIVVAFGTSTKESFTGSASVVSSDDIAKVQTTEATRALEGVVAGVQLTTASGSLDAEPSLIIRGIGSIGTSSTPLYVVDGVPYDGSLSNINNSDIESITVLKDAASNALYGARGANGVVMITTKKAQAGRASVTFDAKVGWNTKATQEYEYITDPAQYYEAVYAARYNYAVNSVDGLGLSPEAAHHKVASAITGSPKDGGLGYDVFTYPEGQYLIGSNGKLNPNATLGRIEKYNGKEYLLLPDNWMDNAYKSSLRQEYNVNVSGSTDKSSFYASFGYLKNNGIIEGESMYRYTARLKGDYQVTKHIKVGANMGYARYNWDNANGSSEGDSSTGNIFAFANSVAPIYPLYIRDAQGNIITDSHGLKTYDYGNGANAGHNRPVQSNSNGLQAVTLDRDNTEGNAFNAIGFAEVKFLKDFTFTFNAGVGLNEARGTAYSNMWYGQFVTDGGTLEKSHGRNLYYNLQQLLKYKKTIAGKHNLDVLLGHENYTTTTVSLGAYKKNLFSHNVNELNGAVVDGQASSSSKSTYNNEGYFARLQYDYDGKYFVSGSFRRDASSRFAPENRWGNFWSAGASWLINKENWFNASWVDMLKIKASIGSQGNDNIGSYLYTDTYGILNNNGEVAVQFASKGNRKISWETNTNFNTGVDFEFFDGRLRGTAEYFSRKTSDMLFFFTVAPSLGYSGYYDNIGDMRNNGVELSIDGDIIRTQNVTWSAYANFTHYKNKILFLPEERKTKTIEGYSGYATGNKFVGEGLPLNTFLLQKYAGVDPTTGKSLWYKDVLDENGNVTGQETTDKYSDATKYLCSVPTPDVYGGFGTSLKVGGFDFAVAFTYSIGGKAMDSGYARLMASPGSDSGYNIHKDVLKAWTASNPNSDIPRFQANDTYSNASSDRFLTNASYLNFQNAQIGYSLPKKWVSKINVSKIRIYATCDNIFYWSARKGFDPRMSFTGATSDEYCAPVRTLSGGINIVF